MFLKVIVAVDPDQNPKDLEAFLDALNDKVEISEDVVVLPGMVADALEAASPFENVHDKLLIDATSIVPTDPRSPEAPLEGSYNQPTPAWRQHGTASPAFEGLAEVEALPGVRQARLLRNNMLVVSTTIEGTPSPLTGQHDGNDGQEKARMEQIVQLRNSIWQLDNEKNLRWLFITNDDLDMTHAKARRRLLWQLTSRFDVGRGLTFDDGRTRLCWDATTPIPSEEHGVRRWPAVTLHDEETLAKVAAHPELKKYEWPPHLSFGGPE
jgi:3-polyprenyl-4-hydroxybenzoate decarboxylase